MVLGSHNLSKAAWGELVGTSRLHIRHYELSVLLLPSLEKVCCNGCFGIHGFCSHICIHACCPAVHPAKL